MEALLPLMQISYQDIHGCRNSLEIFVKKTEHEGRVPWREMKDDSGVVELLKKQEKNYLNGNLERDPVGKWSFLTHWTFETLTGSWKSPCEKFLQCFKPDDQPSRAIAPSMQTYG